MKGLARLNTDLRGCRRRLLRLVDAGRIDASSEAAQVAIQTFVTDIGIALGCVETLHSFEKGVVNASVAAEGSEEIASAKTES